MNIWDKHRQVRAWIKCADFHSLKQYMWRNWFGLVCLPSCAGCDGQKAHLHVTAEIKSDYWGAALEREKEEIALFVKGDTSDTFACSYMKMETRRWVRSRLVSGSVPKLHINMEQPSYRGWSLSHNILVFCTDVVSDLDQTPCFDESEIFSSSF